MTAVALGLLIALAFGSGDFVGGRASTTASTPAVLAVAQACSVVGALIVAAFVHADVGDRDVVFGALAGAVNVIGLGLLYHALARHRAAVVAPVAAVVGAVVPVTWGLSTGENPSALVVAGIVLAIGAGALIARDPDAAEPRALAAGVAQALLAGFMFGTSLVLFRETSTRSGQWPVVSARIAAFTVAAAVIVVVTARGGKVRFPKGRTLGFAALAGAFDVGATALLLVAVRQELLVVVAPIASLAPAFTVVLALLLTHEHLDRTRLAGLAVALVGLVLLGAG